MKKMIAARSGDLHLAQKLVTLAVFGLCTAGAALAYSTYHSDPSPVISYPAAGTTLLHKELTGFWTYGQSDGQADILYGGESDSWTFDLSAIPAGSVGSARLRLSMVLSDNYQFSTDGYIGRVVLNGQQVFAGRFADLGVEQGYPFGAVFNNWVEVEFPFSNVSTGNNVVEIINESSPDIAPWIALDYIDLELSENISASIDVKPGSHPNSVNPRARGVIPVALVSSPSLLASDVDTATVRFGVTGTEAPLTQSSSADVNADGTLDLVFHFAIQATGITCGSSLAMATGRTLAGRAFSGGDSLSTVGCR